MGALLSTTPSPRGAAIESGVFLYGRSVIYHVLNLYAIRMAGVFMISLATIWLRTGVMRRPWAIVTYLLALVLLLTIGYSLWVLLYFRHGTPRSASPCSPGTRAIGRKARPGRYAAGQGCRMSIALRSTTRTRITWDRMRVNFWFTPLVMSLVAVLLAWTLGWIDARIPNEMVWVSRLVLIGDVSETRMFLIYLGTTILVTAGVVFSLLMVPLSALASQYGSRLLRHFMGDRTTQFVLGMFVGTFVYCWAVAECLLWQRTSGRCRSSP